MLIDELKQEYLEKLQKVKEVYPEMHKAIIKSLSNSEYVSEMPYGTFVNMREIIEDKYTAYDYFI
tara:strand:- start:523 stop:717 length:195 start_codon:yes stop_codon:yes gene_type:complete